MATATKTKNKVATFKIKSANNLSAFLKRFSPISNNLLLEFFKEGESVFLQAKSYTPDRSVVKFSRTDINEIFEGEVPADLVKIGIHDISKITNIFKYFDEGDEIFMDLKHEDVSDETIGIELTFRSKSLKINIGCQDLSLFPVYITGEAMARIVKSVADDKVLKFDFSQSSFAKIKSLCSIDSATDLVRIKIKDGKVMIAGKSFEYELKDVNAEESTQNLDLSFKNEQFFYIDQEDSAFIVSSKKILVKSNDAKNKTIIILGSIE